MHRKVVTVVVAGALAMSLGLTAALAAAAPVATEAGEAAVAYSNALALGNVARAWNLLSESSKKGLDREQFAAAFEKQPAAQKPSSAAVLRALASGAEPPTVAGVTVQADTAFAAVKGTVQVTSTVVLVKEGGGWRVDVQATDKANSRQAAEEAIASMREEAAPASARGPRNEGSLAMLRSALRGDAKDYRVLSADVVGNTATVVVGSDVPVSVVLQEARSGPAWTVRSLAQVDILSEDPLREAALLGQRQACEDQLRQIATAIQMYAASSDDMLPDPSRWLDQIAPYLREPGELHCPADPTPGVSYAMNKNLAGKRRRDIGNQSLVPMIFESTAHTRNASDTGESWPQQPWHQGGVMVVNADGTARLTPGKPSFVVPPAPPGGAPRPPSTRPTGRPGAPSAGGGPGMPTRPRPGQQPQSP